MSFKGKVVVVTGSSGGIGATAIIQFAKEGADVVIIGRNENKLKTVEEKCSKYGQKPLVIKADVSKDIDVKRIIETTIEKFGRIDVLVNNAGIYGHVSILSDDFMKVYDEIMDLNLRGVVFLTHLAAPYLIKSKGNIINISSVAGISTRMPDKIPYCVSKAGLNHFTRSTAMNLASYGVRVNTISPGPVRTDILVNHTTDISTVWEKQAEITALKRVSEPEEIADLIVFLASYKARGITGSEYVTDNGFMCLG